jgi:transcriptional regulator with XRE-family HTH domain
MGKAPKRLKELRIQHGYSPEQMAEKLNCTVFHYYKLESGERNLPIKKAAIVAKLFNVSLDEFFLD